MFWRKKPPIIAPDAIHGVYTLFYDGPQGESCTYVFCNGKLRNSTFIPVRDVLYTESRLTLSGNRITIKFEMLTSKDAECELLARITWKGIVESAERIAVTQIMDIVGVKVDVTYGTLCRVADYPQER